jgi:hypothetical protein
VTEESKDEVRFMISRLPENEKKDADKNSDGMQKVFEIEHGG